MTSMYIESAKPFDEYDKPSKFLICAPIMMIDVADVNALVTGTEIKSTIKPVRMEKNIHKYKLEDYNHYLNGIFRCFARW